MSQPEPTHDAIQDAFFRCIEAKTGAQREEVLHDLEQRSPGNAAEVRRMLACHDAVSFLDRPPALAREEEPGLATISSDSEWPDSQRASTVLSNVVHAGSRVGPYKLREKIGEGGMGEVYVAEQTEPVRRKVALKVVKPGMASKDVIARFDAERQALAMMDHPHIANVLDGGASATGQPYFVMELVRGVPITEYCDRERLSTEERLQLFLSVCRAVQHAHQKGVIHRDIKPTNILVPEIDGEAVPKVIDFGVAKAVSAKLTDQTVYTQFEQVIGTPLYMSPEQAGTGVVDIDTRSDVYSLGVLLYELLTGSTPFTRETLKQAGLGEFRRLLREEEPRTPSQAISTLNAEALSTICERRACDPRKLSQTVRGELDWIVMKALEKDRSRRYETANGLARDVERYLKTEPVEACPPTIRYRLGKYVKRHKVLLTAAALILSSLLFGIGSTIWLAAKANHSAKQAQTEAQRAEENLDLALAALDAIYLDAIGQEKLLGEVVSLTTEEDADAPLPNTPLTELELELLRRGLSFYVQFAKQNAKSRRATVQTAQAFYRVALLQAAIGDVTDAEASYRSAIQRFERLSHEHPRSVEYVRQLADAFLGLANVLPEWSQASNALEKSRQAYSRAIELAPKKVLHYLARGNVRKKLSDPDEITDYEQALALDPNNVIAHLRSSEYYSGGPKQQRDWQKAMGHAQHALEKAPDNPDCHLRLASVLATPGSDDAILSPTDQRTPAVDRSELILEHFARAIELAPTASKGYRGRGRYYARIGEYQQALSDLDRAVEIAPTDSSALTGRGSVHSQLGRYEDAVRDLEKVIAIYPYNAGALANLGSIHLANRNWSEAVKAYSQSLKRDPTRWFYYKRRAIAYSCLKEHAKALEDLAHSLAIHPSDTSAIRWLGEDLLAEAPESFKNDLLQLADDAVDHSPDPGRAYTDRALLYTKLGMYDKADDEYNRATQLDSTSAFAWHSWALNYIARGRIQESCQKLAKATELSPNDWVYRVSLANAHFWLGEFAEAAEHYTQALQQKPTDHECLSGRCIAYLILGGREKARRDFSVIRKIGQADIESVYHETLIAVSLQDKAAYRACCRKLLEQTARTGIPQLAELGAWACVMGPDAVDDYSVIAEIVQPLVEKNVASLTGRTTLGASVFRAGQSSEAIEQLTAVVESIDQPNTEDKSSPAYAWYFLAMAHLAEGNSEEAASWLDKANQWTDKLLEERAQGDNAIRWNRRLTFQFLREEAEGVWREAEAEDVGAEDPSRQ